MDNDVSKRINTVCEEAMEEFWAVVAQEFPEAESGDMMPGQEDQFNNAAHSVIKIWLTNNTELLK